MSFSTLTSVALTTPALTINNIVSGGYSAAVEKLLRHYDKSIPSKTLGNQEISVTFVTTDPAVIALCDGFDVKGVTLTFGASAVSIDPDDFTLTKETNTLTFTCSDMYVDGDIAVNASNEGKDLIEYTVTLKAQQTSANALPTIAVTYSNGSGGGGS